MSSDIYTRLDSQHLRGTVLPRNTGSQLCATLERLDNTNQEG